MENILSKTYTTQELSTIYLSDTINIHDELMAQFKNENPDAKIKQSAGEPFENEDGTFTYVITIKYEN